MLRILRCLRPWPTQTLKHCKYNFPCNRGVILGFLGGIGISFLIGLLHYVYVLSGNSNPLIKSLSKTVTNEYGLNYNQLNDKLFSEIRIVCLVLTAPKNHLTKAIHVKNTWGKRCNKLLFISTENDVELGAIELSNVKEGRKYLWIKTREAFKYAYENHFDEADWFLKADDDTYVILENLRKFLLTKSTKDPVYYGCNFRARVTQGFMSGGAGYVLSKEALKIFGKEADHDYKKCNDDKLTDEEDAEIGKCLQEFGVKAGDSRDDLGRFRFLPFSPEYHVVPGEKDEDYWYWKYIFYDQEQGLNCCSTNPISFHYITPSQMYVLEYLIYNVDKPV